VLGEFFGALLARKEPSGGEKPKDLSRVAEALAKAPRGNKAFEFGLQKKVL